MADHSELVAEMQVLEKLGTQERMKQAKKRRMQQLKRWSQREKDFMNKKADAKESNGSSSLKRSKNHQDNVHFVPSVMLLEAASRNDVEEVRRLLKLNVDPDSTNEDGLTALHQCSIDGSEEMMKLLIEFGANVNAKDSEQWTPLHAAATCGNLQLVKYLISKGANLLAVNADGNMPYDICEHEATLDYIEQQMASRGITQHQIEETRAKMEMQMLQFLREQIEAGVSLESIEFDSGASALHVAAANGYLDVVELLLEHNFPTNVVDCDLWQPIHAAACWGHPDVVEMLVQAGADLNAITRNNETPLDICEDLELKERIEKLKTDIEERRQEQQNSGNSTAQSRLKRSHSQNTRSQSVRRTSIREKSLISRREAREEARLRRNSDEEEQPQSQQPSFQSISSESSAMPVENDFETDNNEQFKTHQSVTSVSLIKPEIAASTTISSTAINTSTLNNAATTTTTIITTATTTTSSNHTGTENILESPTSTERMILYPSYETASSTIVVNERPIDCNGIEPSTFDDSKLSRMVRNELNLGMYSNGNYSNMGTLADLKKQRADLRNRFAFDQSDQTDSLYANSNVGGGINIITSTHNGNNLNNNRFTVNGKIHYSGGSGVASTNCNNSGNQSFLSNSNFLHPPSPSSTLKKFCGDPSDVVGEINKKGCCILM